MAGYLKDKGRCLGDFISIRIKWTYGYTCTCV